MSDTRRWDTAELPEHINDVAKDGSEVRRLVRTTAASVVHCTLRPGATSHATRNRGIDEVWYIVGGRGEVWRKDEGGEDSVLVGPGSCLTIPRDVHFQFRASGEEPLTFICITTPPWPGPDANKNVVGKWEALL